MAQCWNNRLLRLFRKIIYLRCSDYVLKKIFVVQKIINIFIKADILPNKSVNCFRLIRALNVKPIAVFVFWFIIHNHLPYKVYGLVGCSQWQLLSCAVSRRGVCPAAYPWRCAAVSKTLRSPWDSATGKSKKDSHWIELYCWMLRLLLEHLPDSRCDPCPLSADVAARQCHALAPDRWLHASSLLILAHR